jgi:hypothetical protein
MVDGTYPIPNVSRCYHIPTMMIITALGVKDKSTGRFVRRSISSTKTTDEMLFIMMAIIVVKTIGGTLLFQLFHQYLEDKDIISANQVWSLNSMTLLEEYGKYKSSRYIAF